jgi:hypothetical protein
MLLALAVAARGAAYAIGAARRSLEARLRGGIANVDFTAAPT